MADQSIVELRAELVASKAALAAEQARSAVFLEDERLRSPENTAVEKLCITK